MMENIFKLFKLVVGGYLLEKIGRIVDFFLHRNKKKRNIRLNDEYLEEYIESVRLRLLGLALIFIISLIYLILTY
jgi:hypothetical protein